MKPRTMLILGLTIAFAVPATGNDPSMVGNSGNANTAMESCRETPIPD